MAITRGRIRRLEQQQHRWWCEDMIRQFENRSLEELRFCARHGYFETRNDSARVVQSEEIRAFEKERKALIRGRTNADLLYYADHGSWPELQ